MLFSCRTSLRDYQIDDKLEVMPGQHGHTAFSIARGQEILSDTIELTKQDRQTIKRK
jgi:hypothetical protein